MPAKILVESFYSHTIQSTLSTTDTSVIVDIAPANDVDYAVLEIGEANQEMIKWVSRVGTTLSGLLRGLSLTATTDTEVAGNKKTHSINDTIEITDVHYLINDKVSNAATETIVGQKTFSSAVIQSVAATGATELIRYGEAVKNTGDETIAGIKTFSSIPLLPNSSPTTDNQAARKKYIDDAIAALGLSTIIASHAIYTPAYLTGDTGAQTTIALWDSVANGSFRGTFDGVAMNVDGIDFTATGPLGIVTSMANVAAVIQHYLRIATGSTETVVWSTDHFVITSANTTSTSQVSVLTTSTGTVGTDISGAGASDWMDCDTGNGVATAAVLDPTQDFGKLFTLDANGLIADEFVSESSVLQHLNDSLVAGENVTAGNALRSKIDGLAYKAQKYLRVGGLHEAVSECNDSSLNYIAMCQISDNKVVFLYHATAALLAKVVTFDGEDYTLGASTNINGAFGAGYVDVCKVGTDKFAIVHWDDAAVGVDDGVLTVCTVSGTTITPGTPVAFESGTQVAGTLNRVCSPATDVVTVVWADAADSSKARARTATISGTVPTFGAEVAVSTTANSGLIMDVCKVDTNVVAYTYTEADGDLYVKAATISGNTMTEGAAVVAHASITASNARICQVAAGKFAVTYYDGTIVKMVVCSVSGNTVTAGTPVSIANTDNGTIAYPIYWIENTFAVVYFDTTVTGETIGNNAYVLSLVKVSGTVPAISKSWISFGEKVDVTTSNYTKPLIDKLNNDQISLCLVESAGADLYFQNFADNNFIGFAKASKLLGETVGVDYLKNTAQSGLTPGQEYYLGADGALANIGHILAGTAFSATTIVKK